MRITGGVLGGRQLKVPRDAVRPTQDMVREALFSILGERTVGCSFLDLYAGSGAVGIEAWSRGADTVFWVEAQRKVASILKGNVATLCRAEEGQDPGIVRVVSSDAAVFLKKNLAGMSFDIIFADPPYGHGGKGGPGRGQDISGLLGAALNGDALEDDGLFIVESASKQVIEEVDGWSLVDSRVYGHTALSFFKLTG